MGFGSCTNAALSILETTEAQQADEEVLMSHGPQATTLIIRIDSEAVKSDSALEDVSHVYSALLMMIF